MRPVLFDCHRVYLQGSNQLIIVRIVNMLRDRMQGDFSLAPSDSPLARALALDSGAREKRVNP
jgi:hypothetical protein